MDTKKSIKTVARAIWHHEPLYQTKNHKFVKLKSRAIKRQKPDPKHQKRRRVKKRQKPKSWSKRRRRAIKIPKTKIGYYSWIRESSLNLTSLRNCLSWLMSIMISKLMKVRRKHLKSTQRQSKGLFASSLSNRKSSSPG